MVDTSTFSSALDRFWRGASPALAPYQYATPDHSPVCPAHLRRVSRHLRLPHRFRRRMGRAEGHRRRFVHAAALGGRDHLGLVLCFGLAHSVMARAGFKRVWTSIVPPARRAKHVCSGRHPANRAAVLAVAADRRAPVVDHHGRAGPGRARAAGRRLGIALLSTYLIDHFELFGLRQGLGSSAPARSAHAAALPLGAPPALLRHVARVLERTDDERLVTCCSPRCSRSTS